MEVAQAAVPAAPSRAQQVRNILQPIADRLGTPGAAKLAQAAKRAGQRVSRAEIRDFLSTKGQKQIFQPLPQAKGKTGTEGPTMRWMMDLVDLKYSPSRGFRNILVLINVYDRKLYAQPVKNKSSSEVATVLRSILSRLPARPVFIFSDAGPEFLGEVQVLLDRAGITQKMRSDPHDVNALAVLDRAIQNLKKRLAESLSERPGEWSQRVAEVVEQYNKTPHETLLGEPPDEIRENKTVQFLLDQDNAKKLKHNQDLLEKRVEKLQDEGAFRRPVGNLSKFRRGFKATYGPVEQVAGIQGSLVQSTTGAPTDIKRIIPVDPESTENREGFALGEVRRERARVLLQPLFEELLSFLGDDTKSFLAATNHLKKEFPNGEYERYLRRSGAGIHLSNILRFFEDELEQSNDGYYLRAL